MNSGIPTHYICYNWSLADNEYYLEPNGVRIMVGWRVMFNYMWMTDSERALDFGFEEAKKRVAKQIEATVQRLQNIELLRNTGHIPVRTEGEFIFRAYRFAMPSNFTIPTVV